MIPLSRPIIGDEEARAVDRVLRSGRLTSGPEVASFEAEYAAFVGTSYAVAVGSGTAALHLGLLAMGVGPGDEVVVPSFTFAATANAARLCGSRVIFVDVDPVTYCLDPDEVEAAINPRTVAVIAVHLYGHPAPLRRLRNLTERAGVALVEDAAQAHGASWEGKSVGSWGTFAAFSFYPTKNMTTGEGGIVTTDDEHVARRIRLLRNQGMEKPYFHEIVGMNERMTEIEAALGRVQLRRLPVWNRARQENAAHYQRSLEGSIITPATAPEAVHVFHQYTVRVSDRDRVTKAFDAEDVGYGIYYPIPVHQQIPYVESSQIFGIAEQLAKDVLSIPVRPDLTEEERQRVTEVLHEAASG